MTTIFTFTNGVAVVADTHQEALKALTEALEDYDEYEPHSPDNLEDPSKMEAVQEMVKDFTDLNNKFFVISQDPESTESRHDHMLETYGEDLIKAKLTNPNHIWTILEADNSLTYVCPGLHYVNRVGYIQTLIPWEDTNEIFLW